jgi:hypothetical protein
MGKLLPLRHGEACGPSAGRAVLLDAGHNRPARRDPSPGLRPGTRQCEARKARESTRAFH